MAIAVEIPELAVVELVHDVAGELRAESHPRGAVGVIVSAHPEDDAYTVEFSDAKGRTVDLVTVRSADLRVTDVL